MNWTAPTEGVYHGFTCSREGKTTLEAEIPEAGRSPCSTIAHAFFMFPPS